MHLCNNVMTVKQFIKYEHNQKSYFEEDEFSFTRESITSCWFFYPPWKTINKLLNSFFVLRFIMRRLFYCPKVNGGCGSKNFFLLFGPPLGFATFLWGSELPKGFYHYCIDFFVSHPI